MEKSRLQDLIHLDLYGENGLVQVMGENPDLINDIPAYQEQLNVLNAALIDGLVQQKAWEPSSTENLTDNKLFIGQDKIVLTKRYCHSEMEFDYFWLVQNFPKHLYAEQGTFVLMYSIEEKESGSHIFPEWFALFSFGEKKDSFFVLPVFHSTLKKNNFALTDCDDVALHRAQVYGLQTTKQIQKLARANSALKKHGLLHMLHLSLL